MMGVLKSQWSNNSKLHFILQTLTCFALSSQSFAVTKPKSVAEIKLANHKVSKAFEPRRFIFLVGINEFSDKRFRNLNYPLKDVADVSNFVRGHNAKQNDEYFVMRGDEATLENVRRNLDLLEKRNISENDIVLVYFSTHGTLAYENKKTLGRFAVMTDSNFDDIDQSALSIEYLQNRLSRMVSKRKALILALCHSGTGKSQLPGNIQTQITSMKGEFFAQPIHEVSSAMMILSASGWGQPAREDDKLSNDIYTHFLLEGLKKNDSNQDGAISLFEAHEYARSKTYDFTMGQQTPSALVNMEGSDPIILNGEVKRQGQPLVFADSDHFRDLMLEINGQTKGTLWRPQTVPSGRVRIALVDPKDPKTPLIDHQMILTESKSYSVSSLMARQPSYGVEAIVHQLPIRPVEDGTISDTFVGGLGLRASEILATAFDAEISYFDRRLKSSMNLDYDQANVDTHIALLKIKAGYSFFPTNHLSLNANLGFEFLTLERNIDNESFAKTRQTASLNYPVAGLDLRRLNIFRSLYVGAGLNFYPLRQVNLKLNDKQQSLQWLSSNIVSGFTF